MKSGVLSLGTRRDAKTWEKGCKGLGCEVQSPLASPAPSMDALMAFFRSNPEWAFLAGHFGGTELSNEDGSVVINFRNDGVRIQAGGRTADLKKGTAAFRLAENCRFVLWGGCSVCAHEQTIRTMRALFGEHLLVGFAGLTGWKMVDAMLGGGFIKPPRDFFSRLAGHVDDLPAIRNAWLETAKYGYGNSSVEARFRAIDPDGQEWQLRGGRVARGRRIS